MTAALARSILARAKRGPIVQTGRGREIAAPPASRRRLAAARAQPAPAPLDYRRADDVDSPFGLRCHYCRRALTCRLADAPSGFDDRHATKDHTTYRVFRAEIVRIGLAVFEEEVGRMVGGSG